MHFTSIALLALFGSTAIAATLPKQVETTKRNTNICPNDDELRCCETNDDGVIVNCIYPGKVDSIEDFKEACEDMNKKESKEHKGPKRDEGEEEEDEEEDRKGKQAMCCSSEDTSSFAASLMDGLMPRAFENICTDVDG